MVTVICCYNRKEDLDKMLISSLQKQTMQYELILVDNSKREYTSAAAALNDGAKRANGDILVFAHQDVVFRNKEALSKMIERFRTIAQIGDIVGVAGAIAHNKQKVVVQGTGFNTLISSSFEDDYKEVESIDECVIIMHKEAWQTHPFDVGACPSWHFYGVEVSYYARLHGHKAYVVNADVLHESLGNLNDLFYKSLITFRKKYKYYYQYIVTTCIYIDINPLSKYLQLYAQSIYRKIRKTIKRMIGRG